MDKSLVVEELKTIIGGYLETQGLDLIDLIYRFEGRDLFLSILVDYPEGGISIGECARLNSELSNILDEKNILQEKYILEVSSPGLDRPLRTEKDFLRYINKKVRVFLSELVDGKIEWVGAIIKVENNSVCIDCASGLIEIPVQKIKMAKQVLQR